MIDLICHLFPVVKTVAVSRSMPKASTASPQTLSSDSNPRAVLPADAEHHVTIAHQGLPD
jgi:hypothetical protein